MILSYIATCTVNQTNTIIRLALNSKSRSEFKIVPSDNE